MIENYVHWNEDIGEWQLVSSLCTANSHTGAQSNQHLFKEFHSFFLVICLFQKCVAYTGNNMRKQTPAPDKKEKDVSCGKLFLCNHWYCGFFFSLYIVILTSFSFLLVTVAIWGGSVSCVSSLHRGEYAAVADETREAQDL